MFSQNKIALGQTYVGGIHDLIGRSFLEHSILVYPRLMGKGIGTDNRLVGLHRHTGNGAYQPAAGVNMLNGNISMDMHLVRPGANGHNHLFHGSIAGPLTQAVNRAFNLAGAVVDSRKRVGHSQAKIIMAMNTDNRLIDISNIIYQVADLFTMLIGQGIAGSVRKVDGCGTRLNDGFKDPADKVYIASGGIFRRKLDIGSKPGRIFD